MAAIDRLFEAGSLREALLECLRESARLEASELWFKAPSEPLLRVDGTLKMLAPKSLTAKDTLDIAHALAALAGTEWSLAGRDEFAFTFGVNGVGRFRATIFRQRGSHAVVVHRFKLVAPSLDELGSRDAVALLGVPGLSIVAGQERRPLIHALIREYNHQIRGHLVVLERTPLYLHRDDRALITHREIGADVTNVEGAILDATMHGTDQLVVVDVPTPSVLDAILRVAEDGVPVIAGLAAPEPTHLVEWMAHQFGTGDRSPLERRLKAVLRGVRLAAASTGERKV